MKKYFGLMLLTALPLYTQAAELRVNVDGPRVQQGGNTTITYGSRDKRGYYWDGNQWRDPDYWAKNQGKGKGSDACPPGQAKKGNCLAK